MTAPAAQPSYPSTADVPDGAIVVGIDGRSEDAGALDWATAAARDVGAPVHIVTALDLELPLLGAGDALPMVLVEDALDDRAEDRLAQACARVGERAPEVTVTAYNAPGRAARVLIQASERAREIVLGSAGGSGLDRVLLGSTSTSVIGLAQCPVVVTGARIPADGDVVVGFDGSAHSRHALQYAAATAERFGTRLRVVQAWYVEVVDGVVATTPGSPEYEQVQQRYAAKIDAELAPLRERHPGVEMVAVSRQGKPSSVVLEESDGARLLVVGSRGRGGIAGMLFGSVSRTIIQSATVPVAVLKPRPS